MKTILFLIVFIMLINTTKAQYPTDIKSDYSWLSGYGNNISIRAGTSMMNFSSGMPDTSWRNKGINIDKSQSSISDTSGNLLFFTNGFCAYDSSFEKIEGTDSMNCCNLNFILNYNTGYPGIDVALILKKPSSETDYYIIHKPAEYLPDLALALDLRYTLVRQETDTFVGVLKNEIIISDSIYGAITIEACRHANGRDWWIIQNFYRGTKFFVFLLDPTGIYLKNVIEPGGYLPNFSTQCSFSNDGSKYIIGGMYNAFNDSVLAAIYNFDRCTGMLSNPSYDYFKGVNVLSSGCAVSPNSKYLYISTTFYLYQYDISVPDWQNTRTIVAEYDGFADTINNDPWPTSFARMQLAPDNKIYFTGGATHYLNTIDNPNEVGIACNVSQHSVRLPSVHARTISNFPNYRLGPIDGSDCDTLGIDVINNIEDRLDNNTARVNLYPNPARDYITLIIPRITKSWEFVIYDIQGKEVFRNKSRGAFRSYDISFLASGLYVWKLRYEDGRSENGKLVKE